MVTYCSTACASSDETGAVKAPAETKPNAETKAKPAVKKVEPKVAPEPPSRPKPRFSGRTRKIVMLSSGVMMLTGMVIAVMQGVSTPSTSAPPTQPIPVPAPTPLVQDAPPSAVAPEQPVKLDPAKLRVAAIAELEAGLESDATRVQRISGIALARVKHGGATKVLLELLKSEDSDLSRVDIAYGLATAGEAAGREYLVKELSSKRRDVRIDAARRLVQLKDAAGRQALRAMLGIRSHKLGAAAELALLGDENGLGVLHDISADSGASKESKMRAAVALGRAGDASAREALLAVLNEGRYVVDAAGALAVLGDEAAVPALTRQLELTGMRVSAAEGLRLMKHEVDFTSLASALTGANADGKIAAAEAILILTGTD